jgi:integrative and conjugative element protein (TIGR02256 family)
MTTLYITPKAWRQIERAVRKNPLLETGGILMGYALNETDWLVTYASEPGPNAIQARLSVRFDDQYLRKLSKRLKRRGRWEYIGDWHSHTVRRLTPSRADRHTVSEKAATAKYTSSSPIMLIVGLGKRNQMQARAYILTDSLREVQQIAFAEQPVRRQRGGITP